MQWISAVSRILMLSAAGALLGAYMGSALVGVTVTALMILLFWVYQTYHLERWLEDTSATPPDLFGLWGDITSQVYRMRREGDTERERLQSTVDYLLESFAAMRDGIVIIEGEAGAIRWSNQAAQSLLGLRYPDDLGQAITNLVRLPEFNEYITEGDYSNPLLFRVNGETRLHLSLVVTRFAEGDRLLFLRDVTDRVRTDEMRRDFVANVSHELRTPLTVITGYLGTFLGNAEVLPERLVRPLQQMQQQSERMENLLKDLLWLSRIETEERHEKQELVDLGALLEELKDELSTSHPERELRLELECQQKILGDFRELYSAVSNLVLNAYKYSDQDAPVFASWRQEGRDCLLSVRDQGIGVDESHLPRLTERFYRVDDSRSAATGGTGLGLAIVKHVAAAHQAELRIDSELGRGSTFTLVFPPRHAIMTEAIGHVETG